MKSAAELVGFAALFGLVMLLAVFGKPVVSGDREVRILGLRRTLGFFAAAMFSVQAVDECRVRGVTVLAFGVFLRSLLLPVFARHYRSFGIAFRNHSFVAWIRSAANVGPHLISRL